MEVEKVTETLTATVRLRLTEVDLSGGWLLRLKGVVDDPIVWRTDHAIGAPIPVSQRTIIPFEVPSQGFYLNLPALSAEDGQTGAFWLGAAPASSLPNAKWRGAVVYRSGDGVSFSDFTAITTAVAWAKARTVLPAHERWGVWDEDNVLDVLIQSPGLEFESRNELEVLNGANLLLVGREIVQFAEAEQLGASEWRLSKLLRVRRGTEWAMATHQVSESVLDPATLTRTSSLDEVGLSRFYRAVSIGSNPSLPEAITFTNEAASLKPYAPVHIRGSRNGAGDLTITWTRRTRFSGEWRDLVDVPLNETSEAYEVDVFDGGGLVARTLGSSSPSVVYATADQTTDFGEAQGAIEVAVYQLSVAIGRGFPVTGEHRGWLIEGSRTNHLRNSAATTDWSKTNVTASEDVAVAPDGTLSADKLIDTAISGAHAMTQSNGGLSLAQPWTFSVFARAAERRRLRLRLRDQDATTNSCDATFDLVDGTVTATAASGNGSVIAAGLEPWPDGWCRCRVTGQPNTSGSTMGAQVWLIGDDGSSSYLGDGMSGLYVWGLQLEAGRHASSYIATGAAAATRAADQLTVPLSAFPYNTREGTLFATVSLERLPPTSAGGRPPACPGAVLEVTTLTIRIPMRLQRRGGRKRTVAPDGSEITPAMRQGPDAPR